MQVLAVATGVFLIVVSLCMLARPGTMMALANHWLTTRWRYLVALIRLLVGVIFLAAAAGGRYPGLFEILGWLFVVGGLLLVALPSAVMERIGRFVASFSPWVLRLAAPPVFLFGAFVVHAFT